MIKQVPDCQFADKVDPGEWRDLVANSRGASVFHTLEWQAAVVESFDEASPLFAIARDKAGRIIAGLPFIVFEGKRLKRIIPIHEFQSATFGLYGGPIFRRGAVEADLLDSVLGKLDDIMRVWRARSIAIVDNRHDPNYFAPYGFSAKTLYTHTLNLGGSLESVKQNFSRTVRQNIKRAERSEVSVGAIQDAGDLDAFYDIATSIWQKHGRDPVYPRDLYRNLYSFLAPQGMIRVHLARYRGQPIGGSMHFLFGGRIYNWMSGSYSEYLDLRPNHLLVSTMIEEGVQEGYKEYDFGSSPPDAAGLIAYKESFGATQVPYRYWTRGTPVYGSADRLRVMFRQGRRLARRHNNLPQVS